DPQKRRPGGDQPYDDPQPSPVPQRTQGRQQLQTIGGRGINDEADAPARLADAQDEQEDAAAAHALTQTPEHTARSLRQGRRGHQAPTPVAFFAPTSWARPATPVGFQRPKWVRTPVAKLTA